tara:strand:+ start:6536 stop:7465 length:930 start_codon:yes stop_codon:yes gene_type:complete
MSYLLVDFGASFVKTAILSENNISNRLEFSSPFNTSHSIEKCDLISFFDNIFGNYPDQDKVIVCCIMNGGYIKSTYYSWKSKVKHHDNVDLISGLFSDETTFHQHLDHNEQGISDLAHLGRLLNKEFYSSLADTECVRRSIDLKDGEFIINLGTGSQILSKGYTHSFIPSGRALNLYFNFFNEFGGFDMWEYLKSINYKDLLNCDITFDLNVFKEAHLFSEGGSIGQLVEGGVTKKSFFSSLLRSYIMQYVDILKTLEVNKIYLTGGISKKYPIIREFISKQLDIEAIIVSELEEDTILGMRNAVRLYL